MAVEVVIIGAGPYGLSIAAHLRAWGIPYRIFGTALESWRLHMPQGMHLKSDGFASNLSDAAGRHTLAAWCRARGVPYADREAPVALSDFTDYALEFQKRFVPELNTTRVVGVERDGELFSLHLGDGAVIEARHVVMAVGLSQFPRIPKKLAGLSPMLFSHSSQHHDLGRFGGKEVVVIGAGSSAVDLATLLAEKKAQVRLVARDREIRFTSQPRDGVPSRWQRLLRPESALGPGLRSWMCAHHPQLFRFLPAPLRHYFVHQHLGPRSAWEMKARLESRVDATLGIRIAGANEKDGKARLILRLPNGKAETIIADHVISATGYALDLDRLPCLRAGLRSQIRMSHHLPVLTSQFECSVPGLFFVGPIAAGTFGPLMRFVAGAGYVAPRIAETLAARLEPSRQPMVAAAT